MCKKYFVLVMTLVFGAFGRNALAQSASTILDSSYANDYARSKQYLGQTLNLRHINVKKGDSICYSVEVFDQLASKSKMKENLFKVVAPIAVIEAISSTQGTSSNGEQKNNKVPAWGVGLSIPLSALSTLSHQNKSKLSANLVIKDESNNILVSANTSLRKATRNHRQHLTVSYTAKRDGYIQLEAITSGTSHVMLDNGKVAITHVNNEEGNPKRDYSASALGDGDNGGFEPSGGGHTCTVYFTVYYENDIPVGADYLYTDCGSYADPDPTGQIGYYLECSACKRAQKDAFAYALTAYKQALKTADSDRSIAAYTLIGEIGACAATAAGVSLKVTEGGLIVIVIPVVGEVVEVGAVAVAILTGLGVFSVCGTYSTFSYLNAIDHVDKDVADAQAALENARASYSLNTMSCGNCPNP